jgi:predicted lipoprotein with Yx(FWY)xxD motif
MSKSYSAFALAAVALALVVAGCGSSGGSSSSGSAETSSSSAGSSEGSPSSSSAGRYGNEEATSTSSEASAPSGEAVVVAVGPAAGVGQVLVDPKGMTLYYFQKDQKGSGKSKCEGACASAWPPLTTSAAAKGIGGVKASMLGTIERPDGTTQVTYAGWPLYTFVEDKKPGEDNGTDSKAFGASWYPLHPNGQKAGH